MALGFKKKKIPNQIKMASSTIIIIPEELPCLYLLPTRYFQNRYQHQRPKYEFMEQDGGRKRTDIFKTIMFQTDDDEIVLFK